MLSSKTPSGGDEVQPTKSAEERPDSDPSSGRTSITTTVSGDGTTTPTDPPAVGLQVKKESPHGGMYLQSIKVKLYV